MADPITDPCPATAEDAPDRSHTWVDRQWRGNDASMCEACHVISPERILGGQ